MLAIKEFIYPEHHVGMVQDMAEVQALIEDYLVEESEGCHVSVPSDSDASSPLKLCKCGCGKKPLRDGEFAYGHFKLWIEQQPKIYCACGCGGEIIIRRNHKYKGIPKFLKGHHLRVDHPFKGKKLSKKTREKMSKSQSRSYEEKVGKERAKLWRQRVREAKLGEKNYAYGTKHTEEWKKKLSIRNSGENNPFYGKKQTEEAIEKRRCSMPDQSKENNPNWKGGTSFYPYPVDFDEKLKSKIRDRGGHRCMLCGGLNGFDGKTLAVHHVDYDKNNCTESNLASLCNVCNSKVNGNRPYWTKHFRNLLSKLYGYEYSEDCLKKWGGEGR